MYFLYQLLGPSVIAGAGVLVLSVPLNTMIARAMRTLKKTQMKNRDSRVRLMVNTLSFYDDQTSHFFFTIRMKY
jgi:hypothetical protein